MAETRVFKSRGGLRHALGLTSLVLSLCSGVLFLMALSPDACCEQGYDLTGYRRDGRAGLRALGNLPGVRLPPPDTCSAVLRRGGASEAGSWVAMAVAGWMVGASVLWYAGAQEVLWTPFGDGPEYAPEPEVAMVHEAPPPKRDSPMKKVQPKPPPSGPPEAILTNAHHRDAGGFEGTFCWEPEWAQTCVEDAGIPVLPEQDTLIIRQGGDCAPCVRPEILGEGVRRAKPDRH